MKSVYKIFILFFIICSITGCTLINNDNIHYFSINIPQDNSQNKNIIKKDFNIKIMPFSYSGTYGSKMVFTQPPGSVFFDNYNCWAQKPGVMLTNYFTLFLAEKLSSQGNDIKNYILSGSILNFEGNMETEKTNFVLKLVLKDNYGKILINKIYTDHSKMKKLSASAFAEALSISAGNIANEFLNNLKDIQ